MEESIYYFCTGSTAGCTSDAKVIKIYQIVIGVLAGLLAMLGPLGLATLLKFCIKHFYQRCLCMHQANCCQCQNHDELQPLIQNKDNNQEEQEPIYVN